MEKRVLLIFAVAAITFYTSCEKDEPIIDCQEIVYVPNTILDWLPYYTNEGDIETDSYAQLENEVIFADQADYFFTNSQQDTQVWRLVYLESRLSAEPLTDCPEYQKIDYTIYNSQISKHFKFSLKTRSVLESVPTTEEFTTQLYAGAFKTQGEDVRGSLQGTGTAIAYNLEAESTPSSTEILDVFTTPYAEYTDVVKMKLSFLSDANLRYNFFIARTHGLVAYEFDGEIWAVQ